MNRGGVQLVEKRANSNAMATVVVTHAAEKIVRCLRPSVLLAVKRLQYLLSLPVTDQFTAEIVSRLDGTVATDKQLRQFLKGLVEILNPFLLSSYPTMLQEL